MHGCFKTEWNGKAMDHHAPSVNFAMQATHGTMNGSFHAQINCHSNGELQVAFFHRTEYFGEN